MRYPEPGRTDREFYDPDTVTELTLNSIAAGPAHFLMIETGKHSGGLEKVVK